MWIFIDTNIYLDFYRGRNVGLLLKSLESVKDKIFIPQPIRNEVIRNRVNAALERINEDKKKLSIKLVPFPDLLTTLALDDYPSLQNDWTDLGSKSKELEKRYKSVLAKTVCHVAQGIDPISKSLQSILENARPHNEEQLTKARLRKELGNLPGKRNAPLGDQLAWEQLISTVKDDEDIWIVSRDADYLVGFDNQITLNPFLYEEFAKQRRGKVYTFQDLASALQHYKTNADSKLDLPSQEELDLAKKEQRSLSNKSQCNCLDGPSPIGGYENRFYIVRCQKCGVILGMQEDYYSYSD